MNQTGDTGQATPHVHLCTAGSNQCELTSLSAFQVGSLIVILVGIALIFIESLRAPEGTDQYLIGQFWTLFGLTVLYYTVNEWFLEERHCLRLRQLAWHNRYHKALPQVEFWMRVSMTALLGFTAALHSLLKKIGVNDIDTGFFCLLLLYNLFLLWDVIVAIGGQVQLVWSFFWADLLGALISFGFYSSYVTHKAVAAVLASILLLLIAYQFFRLEWLEFVKRLWTRDKLR